MRRAAATAGAMTILGLLACAACSSARRGEPLVGPFTARGEAELTGRRVFMRACHECHPGGMAGVGPSINDKPLPRWLIRFQVRNGLGAMPSFDESKISGEELDALADYLVALRKQSPEDGE